MRQPNAPRKAGTVSLVAILSLALVQMSYTAVTPAMNVFAQHFVGYDVSWISTLPNLFVVLGTLLAGAVAGKRMRFRTIAIAGSWIAFLAGVAPYFIDDYAVLLVLRSVYGFGAGLLFPLANALILGIYDGQRQANILGYSTLCMNVGGIVMQLLSGWLAGVGWNLTFLAHAFVAIACVLAFFLPEPAPENARQVQQAAAPAEQLNPRVWLLGMLLLVYNMMNFCVMMNMATVLVERSLGGPEAASVVLALFTVAGVIAGSVYGKLFQRAPRWVLSLAWGISAVGALIVFLGTHIVVIGLGTCLIGFGFSTLLPGVLAWAGMITPASTVARATSVAMAMMSLGAFLGSFWLMLLAALFGESVYSAIVVEVVAFAIMAVAFALRSPFGRAR